MSLSIFQNLLKITRGFLSSTFRRDFKSHMSCIIPGGGLGKLQGIKEEEYFLRQDNKLVENMKEKSKSAKPPCDELGCFALPDNTMSKPNENVCSVKHKDLIEEAYFLSDHCDSLQLLKEKFKNKGNQGDQQGNQEEQL